MPDDPSEPSDLDRDRLTSRLGRYARVTTGIAATAVRTATRTLAGRPLTDLALAKEMRRLLGSLRGPIMKAGQFAAMIPEILPPEFAAELAQLQTNAPPMGTAFVRRRMSAELGPDWQSKFGSFDLVPTAAASLGQVHKATDRQGRVLACKLQYPDMESAVTADLTQLGTILSLQRTFEPSLDTKEIQAEIAERIREELDYLGEAANIRLFRFMLKDEPSIEVPEVIESLSTRRLLTMTWLDGKPVTSFLNADQATRDQIGAKLIKAWWIPLLHFGVIHGDPHMGNYTVREDGRLNLFDFGCVRILPPSFVQGVIDLVSALAANDKSAIGRALTLWGFGDLSAKQVDTLEFLFRLIYEPLIEDRTRPVMEGTGAGDYMRKFANEKRERFRAAGLIRPPREFVFQQRAMVGLGAVLIQLGSRLNLHQMFMELANGFATHALSVKQRGALIVAWRNN